MNKFQEDQVLVNDSVRGEANEIAVVGIGLTVACANNPEEFWHMRVNGSELFTGDVPANRWDHDLFYTSASSAQDKTYQNSFAFISDLSPGAQKGTDGNVPDDELTTCKMLERMMVTPSPL